MRLTLSAAKMFDGTRFRKGPFRISVEGGVFRSVEEGGAAPGNSHGHVIRAPGGTILPGLINVHTHIVRGGMFNVVEPLSLSQTARNLKTCLAAGVTTVGDMGCTAGLIFSLRDSLKNRPGEGPDIVACGPLLTCPGGYPLDWLPGIFARLGAAIPCENELQARKAVQWLVEKGADHIKLAVMHRSYADRPLAAIRPEVARAICDESHALGRKTLAHAHSVADYEVSLNAGADAIMHSSLEVLPEDMVKKVRDSGVPVCPTLWVFESIPEGIRKRWDQNPRYTSLVNRKIREEWTRFCDACEKDAEFFPEGTAAAGLSRERAREALEAARENTGRLFREGVPLALGNDSAYGFSLPGLPVDELLAMERAGLSRAECLASATKNAAELLGLSDRGRIAPGARADLVIVEGDPEEDLRNLETVRKVLKKGLPVAESAPFSFSGPDFRNMKAAFAGVIKTGAWALLDHPAS